MRLPRPHLARSTFLLAPCLLLTLTTTAASPLRLAARTGRVVGHVRTPDGKPISHAQVFIVGTAINALSDSTGGYLIAAAPEGEVQLRAASIGYKSSQATSTVRAGRTARLGCGP